MKIGFIGAGKVGFSLGKYFMENNITVTGYYSRNEDSAYEASIFTNTKKYNNLEDIINESDAIFITTPDGEIQRVWNELKELSIQNKMICHCSGSLSSNIFSNINKYGAYGYSIHPMLAISDKYNSYKNLKEAFITIEGHDKHISDFKKVIESLGNKTTVITEENKPLYHAASVVVSNLVIGLINNGINYLEKCGFNEEDAINSLYPLITFNIKNIKEKGVVESLTGPVERGDLNTIKAHCNSLYGIDKELYKMLSKNILEIAKIKNKDRDYKEIEEYLGGKK
ncbi:DUF2520 domain-containing protein [Clostridium chauvoei]|uniref:DUF2520 domain-containing protein n=1 Tax=Clostridium chauvoei TaxID=46867 RepID=A0ABD4RJF9_9CLOT|nr:Rossmann-like and DUF2520 domain-containing protein [Clostridium chauvoei]ATD56147.1 hypothetical protein BTM20_00110 [Clostridium chauvoei]ATD58637.1 hypothetical protein BTM21_00110 [Clostridium chauvoei]MBX7281453.1 DUF2520 domain-containing protein [Clostridium chauvoei]MBX7283989.1 DUF2520 domain-containing protein [Clostridium chauvoei]MBX7286501.1 DUF2520 domain-containing protein [Clostridium chauvoei]